MLKEFGYLVLREVKTDPFAVLLGLFRWLRGLSWLWSFLVFFLTRNGHNGVFFRLFLAILVFHFLLLFDLFLLHLLYQLTLNLLLNTKLLKLELIAHQLLHLQHVLRVLLLGSHVLSPFHF